MTPKEKAIQLVNIYLQVYDGKVKEAIQCALNSVNEILESHYKLLSGVNTTTYKYWQEVKQEIINL